MTVEERLAALEQAVADLQATLAQEQSKVVRLELAQRRLRHGEVVALDAGRAVRLQEELSREDRENLRWLRRVRHGRPAR